MKLSEVQLSDLHRASVDVRAAQLALEADRGAVDAAESAALGATYTELAEVLAREGDGPSKEELAALSERLGAARATLVDPKPARWEGIRAVLDRASTFVETLTADQRTAMRYALFFLRKPLSPQFAPAYAAGLFGTRWDDGDFGTIARFDRGAEDPGSLDLGGLWAVDDEDATEAIKGLRMQALVAVALDHPGLCGAVEALQGRRAPADLVPACEP